MQSFFFRNEMVWNYGLVGVQIQKGASMEDLNLNSKLLWGSLLFLNKSCGVLFYCPLSIIIGHLGMPVLPTCISEKPQTLDSPGDCGPDLEERANEQLYTLHSLSDQKEAAGGLLFMQLCIIASQVRGFF